MASGDSLLARAFGPCFRRTLSSDCDVCVWLDSIPMVIEESSIPLKFFRGLDGMSLAKQSLYRALRENYGARVGWADEVIEALTTTRASMGLVIAALQQAFPCPAKP